MSSILIPEKVLVINKATKYPLTMYDSAGAVTTTAADAVKANIGGLGTTKIADVTKLSISRGLTPKQNSITITPSAAGAGTAANTTLYLSFRVESTNREFRLARPEYEFGRTYTYQIVVGPSETAASISTKFTAAINAGGHRNRDFVVKATDNTGTFSITVQSDFRGVFIKESSIAFTDENGDVSTDVTIAGTVVDTQMYKGINYGSDIEFREKAQPGNNEPYYFDFGDIPAEESLYTQFNWEFTVDRPDPKAHDLSEKVRMVVYINEDSAEAMIDALAEFFLDPDKDTNDLLSVRAASLDQVDVWFNDTGDLTNNAAATDATNLNSADATLIKYYDGGAGANYFKVSVPSFQSLAAANEDLIVSPDASHFDLLGKIKANA